ncbi:MAG: hypothetical protein HFE58_13675 [Firmicutes bacterium]|nr:hypothetical protein [Bacillota bacterium]
MNERLKEAFIEFLNSAIENYHLSFNSLENINCHLKYVEQQREKLKKLLEENNIVFPLQEFFDKCILLENRRSEFAYLSGLQDGIEFTKKIEQVKENITL